MAPEVIRGLREKDKGKIGKPVDIWAIGVIAFEINSKVLTVDNYSSAR